MPAPSIPALPGPPARSWRLAGPVELQVWEWGPEDGQPVLAAHGGADFARTFDGFAPLLAAAGHRVVAWDQRGHGDSARAALYGYGADVADAVRLARAVAGDEGVAVLGHSKGGVLVIEVAAAAPGLVSAVVSIDGFVRRRAWAEPAPRAAAAWLDGRRRLRPPLARPAGELAERRQALNPRLERAWIEHLVEVGTEATADAGGDGSPLRRWKVDGAAYPPAPHPWQFASSLTLLSSLRCPFLGLRCEIDDAQVRQPGADELRRHLPPGGLVHLLRGVGHFAHLEAPQRVAAIVTEFLDGASAARSPR
jgi:pimeloyl-ACP methyl ester carboxylesterase